MTGVNIDLVVFAVYLLVVALLGSLHRGKRKNRTTTFSPDGT